MTPSTDPAEPTEPTRPTESAERAESAEPTGPADSSERRRVRGIPARTRIVGWMLLLVGLALAGSVLATQAILLARLDDRIDDELTQEARKLRAYASTAVDPHTGKAFTSVDALLQRYLVRNLPDRDETFFTVIDGRARHRSPDRPDARLDTDPAFVARAAGTTAPTYGEVDTHAGNVRYAVLPVRLVGDPARAALVVEEFRDQGKAREVEPAILVLAGVGLTALILAGVASWLIAGRVLAPVRLVRRTAQEITDTDLGRRIPLDPYRRDDVTALALTFNAMLDRLERAFTTQREFLDDVGHELRTPITVVRGHLELMNDSPEERAETIALVTDELDRMARIVDDLTVLAKAERPDFLSYASVDVADLLHDVLAKARILGDRDWGLDSVVHGVVRADPQRLTQALLQLVSNALRYTSDGDVIALGAAEAEGSIQVWVRDTGAGVPPDVADRVFERFVRAGPRSGAGLGLAIVRAIAETHGGKVALTSRVDRGTTVSMEIPR